MVKSNKLNKYDTQRFWNSLVFERVYSYLNIGKTKTCLLQLNKVGKQFYLRYRFLSSAKIYFIPITKLKAWNLLQTF